MANPNISVDVSGNTAKLQQQINQVARKPLVIDVTSGRGGSQPLGRLTGQITEIDKSLAAANARVIAFGAAAGTIFALENAVASLFSTFVNTEKKLQDINVILNLTDKNLASFGSSLFGIAANTAQSFDIVAEAATELSRQGLGVEETLKRTEAALILTRLSGLDAAASVSALTSAINSFQNSTLEATEIVNKLANVDAAFAVSSADLANALARVGSSADDAGISFDELIALVTTAQQITARGGAVIGNSLKTIFTRLGRGKVQEVLGGLGISATDEQGQVKNQVQLLKELAVVYDTLGATQKNYVAEQVGGVFQINILKAALGDLGKEYSIYDRALKTSLSSTDQAIQRNEQLNQTLSALGSKTLANVQKAAASIGEGLFGDAARNVLNATNFLAEGVSTADSESIGGQIGKGVIDGLGKFISGPGLALATGVIVKLLADFAKYGTEAFRSILGTNTAAKEQAIVQQNIAKFLQNNTGLYDSILKGQISVSSAAKEYLSVIQQQTAALQKQNAIAAAISKNLTGSVGIKTIGGQQFISSGKKGKTAAAGYFPEAIEQANINARIGGANPSVDRPVTIPNFSLGAGKKGTITAHTGEWAVPNFAGGDGTAIFNRDMKQKYGLPKGARKISASGFIPNFAGYSYALSTFAGKGVKNPRAEKQFNKFFENKSFRNIERDDRISGVGFKIQKIKLTPELQALYNSQPGSPAFTSQFEEYAVKKLGFIPSSSAFNGIKLYGGMSAAVDGYRINNGEAKFLEVKGGSFETLAVANKFGRVLPENLRRLPQAELSKLFKEGIPNKQDIVKMDNTLAVPDVRGARGGNFNRPFRVADIEANRSKNLIKASGFVPNFATKNAGKEITNLGDISANPKFASKIVSAVIPQPTKKLLKFSATAKYGDKTYAASGIPVSGPNPDVAKGLSNQNIPNLHRNIGKVLVDQANIFGQSLGATKFISSASELPNLGGVNSAAGVAFERGVQNAIGGSVSGSKRARVDFTSVNPKLKKIFNNAPGVYEAKNRPSPTLINDVFAKFLSRAKPGAVSLTNKAGIAQRVARIRELSAQGLSRLERNKILKREGLAADGFIPNFAATNLIKEINKRITNPNIASKLSEGSGLSNEAYMKAAGKLGVNTSGLDAFLKQPGFPLRGKEKIAGLSRALGFSLGRSFNIDALKLGDWNYVKKSFEENGLTKNDFNQVSKFAKSMRGQNAFRSGFKSKAEGFIPNSLVSGRNKFQAQWIKSAIKNKGLPEEILRDPQIMSKLANIFRKKYPNEQSMFGFSNGFVPNFANNSTNKGIPVSKIRAHFDKSGNPIAVTNTMHEPNGLKDAIQREKRGIGMPGPIKASSGFIPNFAVESNTNEAENAFSKLTAGLSSVALQLALFASIGGSQNQLSEENLKELEYVNKQKRSVERKDLANQIKSARSEARSATTAGLPSRREALLNVKTGFQSQLEAQKSSIAPDFFQKQLSRVKGFRPGLGTAFVAPIIAETAANIIPQETQGGRAAASTVSGLGSIASYTAIGAQFGGKFGAGIGATIGIISTVADVMNQFKSNIPELQAEAGKLQDSFSRTTENIQSLQTAYQKYEQLLESGASQEDLNKAQKNYLEFLTKFKPSEAKQFLGALKSRGSAGIQEVGEAILRPQAQQVSSAEASANLEEVFKKIRSKDLFDVAFGSAGSFKEANKEQLSTLTEIAKAGIIQGKIDQELKKRVQELGGIDKVEENFSLLLREVFNLNTEDIIAIQGSPEFKKQLQEVLKNALQEGLDLAEIGISGLNAKPIKQNINKKLNEITQEILDGIDLDLTYNAKTSPLKALEDQFFSGEVTREQFIGQRSKERLDFASELGLKPEEISKRFGTDIQNVANLFGNLKAQEAADLGLGQKIQERAREVATAKTASEYGIQNVAPENLMTTFLNDLKNLVAKGSITPATASSMYQGAKESSNLTSSVEDLRKNLSGIKPQNGLEKIGMDLVGSTSIALRNFQLAETSSDSIAQNLEKVASLLEKQIDLLGVPQNEALTQPVTDQSSTKESSFSFSLSSPSISIVSQSDGQVLEELDTKLNQGNQRILDEVRGIIQNVKAKNGLK